MAAGFAHLDRLLNGSSHAQVVTPNFARALPLPRGTSPRYLRLSLLGSLNWAVTWYRPGGDSPKIIARRIVELYGQPLASRI